MLALRRSVDDSAVPTHDMMDGKFTIVVTKSEDPSRCRRGAWCVARGRSSHIDGRCTDSHASLEFLAS